MSHRASITGNGRKLTRKSGAPQARFGLKFRPCPLVLLNFQLYGDAWNVHFIQDDCRSRSDETERKIVVIMSDMVRIRRYTLRVNAGFAPCRLKHSQRGYIGTELLTLANCMANMRGVAPIGEWVAGITPSRMTNRLAFLMRVDGEYTRAKYWQRFRGSRLDCIYRPNPKALFGFDQLPNPWHGRTEEAKDLKCNRILWSRNFFWFAQSYDIRGRTPKGLAIPPKYRELTVSQRTRYGAFCDLPKGFLDWVSGQPQLAKFDVIGAFEPEEETAVQPLRPREKTLFIGCAQSVPLTPRKISPICSERCIVHVKSMATGRHSVPFPACYPRPSNPSANPERSHLAPAL